MRAFVTPEPPSRNGDDYLYGESNGWPVCVQLAQVELAEEAVTLRLRSPLRFIPTHHNAFHASCACLK